MPDPGDAHFEGETKSSSANFFSVEFISCGSLCSSAPNTSVENTRLRAAFSNAFFTLSSSNTILFMITPVDPMVESCGQHPATQVVFHLKWSGTTVRLLSCASCRRSHRDRIEHRHLAPQMRAIRHKLLVNRVYLICVLPFDIVEHQQLRHMVTRLHHRALLR